MRSATKAPEPEPGRPRAATVWSQERGRWKYAASLRSPLELSSGARQILGMTANRYFAFALTLAAGCAPAYAPSPAEASRDELAIYTVVIDSVLETAGDPFVVMAESTAVVGLSEQELARWGPGRDSTFPTAAFADLVVRNRTPVRVPARTLTDRDPHLSSC